jgi:uncharacterized membrane protein HdeD (DUF308 family)
MGAASGPAVMAEHRTWFIILGIVLVILGVLAIVFPLASTIVAKTFLGWLLLIGGVVQVVQAFSTQKWGQFILNLIIGILYVLVGGWLAFFPLTGIITLTILLAAVFIVGGILEIGMSFRMRAASGWFWMLISGVIGILAGILIFAGLPDTAAWALGLVAGVNLITSGLAYILLPMAVGSAMARA